MHQKVSAHQGSATAYLDRIPLAGDGSPREEWASTITHAAATIGAAVAIVELIELGRTSGSRLPLICLAVFGFTLLNLYLISTVYHLVRNGRAKRLLRILDHVSILYVIAGSYTVVVLMFLHGEIRWIMLYTEWGLALAGTLYKLLFLGRAKVLSMGFYLVMGWLALVAWPQMIALHVGELNLWLFLGGGAYMAGLVFFGMKRLPYNHAVWHLFVMAGSACHIIGIYQATRIVYG